MEVAAKIADYKKENNLPILVPAREREKLQDVAAKAGPHMANYTRVLYSMLFELSRSYQSKRNGELTPLYHRITQAIEETPKLFPQAPMVACQGVEGAYSQQACDKLFALPNIMYFKTNEVYTAWSANHKVVVDGYVLTHGQPCYVGSSPDGYVLVALNPSFLNYLSPSVVHTIQIGVPGAAATGYFKAYGYSSSIYGVKTGDESQPALWAALCMMSVLGMGAILIIRRKDLRG